MRIEGSSPAQPLGKTGQGGQEESRSSKEQQQIKQTREIFRREIMDEEKLRLAREKLQEELERLSQVSRIFDRRMNFLLHEGSNRLMVQVIDAETDTVIREVPPHEILDIVSKMHTMIGIFLDEYV